MKGEKKHMLTIIDVFYKGKRKYYRCLCDCGNEKDIRSDSFGKTKSCGCLKRKVAKNNADNLEGKIFNNWRVLYRYGTRKDGAALWMCECLCGTKKPVDAYSLKSGKSKSCGCLHKHGFSNERLYRIWKDMKRRCKNPNRKGYKNYGGRGIKVCEEWDKSYLSFREWALNNGYSDELTIERIDNNGNYEPNNCKWIPMEEQQRNTRNNAMIEINGVVKPLVEWCEIKNFPYKLALDRRSRGIDGEDLFLPKKR